MGTTKPAGIYITAKTNHTWDFGGSTPPTDLATWYVALEGRESMEAAAQRAVASLPIGTEFAYCGDHNTVRKTVKPALEPGEGPL